MRARPLRLVVILACGLAAGGAQADIYTWVDASGIVNMSNVAPPEGARVTKVTHDSPPMVLPPRDAAADAARQAEVQALAVRVMQLEYEAEFSRRQIAAAASYVPPQPMYVPQQYVPDYAPPQWTGGNCDLSLSACNNGWWSSGFYPSVFVIGAPGFRRPPPFHGGRKFGMQMPTPMPVRTPGGFNRR